MAGTVRPELRGRVRISANTLRTIIRTAAFAGTCLLGRQAMAQPPPESPAAPAPATPNPAPPNPATSAPAPSPQASPAEPPVNDYRTAGQVSSSTTATPAPAAQAATEPPPSGRFEFGSYGRAHFASDLRGGTGRKANIVAHGTRIDEDDYAELELRREDTFKNDVSTRVVSTLALFGPFFHFTGKAQDQIAVRNLYAQAKYKDVYVWGGYRMYRGDDIYLLNWWPLDNQNTLGGGVFGKVYQSPLREGLPRMHETTLAVHAGQQRLDNPYQSQRVPVVAPFGFGASNITNLDRPRTIETVKLTHLYRPGEKGGFKAALYGEAHQLAAGVQRDPLTNRDRGLPSDSGFMVGSQLTYFTGERDTYVSLFLRHARGLAAYDPLAVPTTFATDRTTASSSETTLAIGANYEHEWLAVMFGGYMRFFRDGDSSVISTQKYDEGTAVVRPQAFFNEHIGLGLEASHQVRRIAVLDRNTDAPLVAQVTRAALIPFISPSGRGSFKRPQLYAIYAISARNDGARALYPAEDIFAQRKIEHYAGLGVEWWFNSSSYP